jgi:hypothetical protein
MDLTNISKEINKNGLLISKEKLIELIKKSAQQNFSIQQSTNNKLKVILIQS